MARGAFMVSTVGITRVGLACSLLLACAACSTAAPASLALNSPSAIPTESGEAAVSQEPRTLTFDIEPMGAETEARGTVEVDISGGGYTLTITVENLVPTAQYPINLHSGQCPNPELSEATAVWIVQQTPADENGTLSYEKSYEGLWEVPAAGRTLTIHGRVPLDARTHIACADLTE